jgi:hypothetical protein
MNPLETYFRELGAIRSSGAATDETSYYIPFANLLNEIGKTLKPKVHCIMNLKNQGAGMPDGGLFTAEQVRKTSGVESIAGQLPARGVIEAKPTSDNTWLTADSQQVSKYWKRYRQVLVTNYRDFVFVGQDSDDKPVKLESYQLAKSDKEFWDLASQPRKFADKHGERFIEYLKRIMLLAAPLSEPKDVAWFLASYARDAKARIESGDMPALTSIRAALEESLGLKFVGTKSDPHKGDHFFRSTLVQTLFYGIFSAWVLWSKQQSPSGKKKPFDWRMTAYYLRVPILRKLFHEIAEPGQLDALNLSEVLEWTTSALNRVDRSTFFEKFEEEHAVQYFYEPFLQAFDPELRKDLGVWFTPHEIVQYMVARIDTVLREELHLPDGLADPNVYVLDPCCGTGAYLVEVLKKIYKTLHEKGGDALIGEDLKRAAMERVFGFEILPAPFVVSHLQLGLLLQTLGSPLSEKNGERASVYLTNALTGWEPPKEPKEHLMFPELEEERDSADEVKQSKPILVILGNPPYNAFAGISPAEEQGLVEPYKEGLISEWKIKKFNLDDLYVRFFRLAERRIAEKTGRGVVSFISNHSWVSDPSFVVLRKHLLESFDKLWIENMHGNRKISEYAPDGKTSETIFAIPGFSAGIQQGVAISLWVKTEKKQKTQVYFRDDLNAAGAEERRKQLLDSLKQKNFDKRYEKANPNKLDRFSFRPSNVSTQYMEWPNLKDFCSSDPSNGLMEKRGETLIDIDKSELEKRMRMYFDPKVDWQDLERLNTGLTKDAARFDAKKARTKVLASEGFEITRLRRYALRPFDNRWCYYTPVRPLWNEPRPSLWAQCWESNSFLISRMNAAKFPEGPPFYFLPILSDDHFLSPDAAAFPVRVKSNVFEKMKKNKDQGELLDVEEKSTAKPTANFSTQTRAYLAKLDITNPDADKETAGLIWMHALAIGYSPLYLKENADGICQDWPRIPLPGTKKQLLHSVSLGKQIAALLDTEHSVTGVGPGTNRPEIKAIGSISKIRGGALAPNSGEIAITAGWGHAGKDGVTMPGKGKLVEREYTSEEIKAIKEGAKSLGLTLDAAMKQLGETTCDVYLNECSFWKNIPINVWEYYIGGYQVIKKWLSYREKELLKRSLTIDEAREVMNMARRIAAIVLLQAELDKNYQAVKNAAYSWGK